VIRVLSRRRLTQSASYAPAVLRLIQLLNRPCQHYCNRDAKKSADEISRKMTDLRGVCSAGVSRCLKLSEVSVEIPTERRQVDTHTSERFLGAGADSTCCSSVLPTVVSLEGENQKARFLQRGSQRNRRSLHCSPPRLSEKEHFICVKINDWVPHPSLPFAKGGISRMCGEGLRVQSSGIPPFAKSAKDGAPDHWFSRNEEGTDLRGLRPIFTPHVRWCERGHPGRVAVKGRGDHASQGSLADSAHPVRSTSRFDGRKGATPASVLQASLAAKRQHRIGSGGAPGREC
jgi:hypothetical protein